MGAAVVSIFQVGCDIWDYFINITFDVLELNPFEAEGSLKGIIEDMYNGFQSVALTLCLIFCLIAILRDCVTSPPGQQLHKLANSALKYFVMIGVVSKLWELLELIISFTDWATSSVVGTKIPLDFTEAGKVILEYFSTNEPSFDLFDIGGSILGFLRYMVCGLICSIFGIIFILVAAACAIIILSAAYQRIFKPLIIMPFSALFVAMGSSNGDSSHTLWNFIKTFLGFCMAGALMAVCIKVGQVVMTSATIIDTFNLDPSNPESSIIYGVLLVTVQASLTPIIIAGLCKSVDSMISKIL